MFSRNIKTTGHQNSGSKVRRILELSYVEKKQFLDSFDFVLSDCDGVIWLLVEPIENSGRAIMLLKNAGKDYKFISNNSMRTDEEYLEKLDDIGVTGVKNADLVHPVKTITRYIHRFKLGQSVFSICSREVNEVFIKNGVKLITMEPNTTLTAQGLLEQVKPNNKVSSVVIDLNFNLTFGELARAHQYLLDSNCSLLVGASDPYVPVSKNFVTIGTAGFIDILRECSGKEPVLLGKPGALLGEDLIEQFNITDRKRVLFIGDSLVNDIQFANVCGFQSLFVLSGASSMDEMLAMPDKSKPDFIADSMADFIPFFEDLETN